MNGYSMDLMIKYSIYTIVVSVNSEMLLYNVCEQYCTISCTRTGIWLTCEISKSKIFNAWTSAEMSSMWALIYDMSFILFIKWCLDNIMHGNNLALN